MDYPTVPAMNSLTDTGALANVILGRIGGNRMEFDSAGYAR